MRTTGDKARHTSSVAAFSQVDLISGPAYSWKIIMEDDSTAKQSAPGIFDVRSGSPKTSLEGTPYAEW